MFNSFYFLDYNEFNTRKEKRVYDATINKEKSKYENIDHLYPVVYFFRISSLMSHLL